MSDQRPPCPMRHPTLGLACELAEDHPDRQYHRAGEHTWYTIALTDVLHRIRLKWDTIDNALTKRYFARHNDARLRGNFRPLDRMRKGITRRCGRDLQRAQREYNGSWPAWFA